MAQKPMLRRFRYIFNRLSDNTKSVVVFGAWLGCFLLVGLLTEFSWLGILLGCLAGYGCIYLLRPIRRRQKF